MLSTFLKPEKKENVFAISIFLFIFFSLSFLVFYALACGEQNASKEIMTFLS